MSDPDGLLASGLTYRQIDNWVRQGYLRPDHAGGSGRDREWPAREIAIGVLMRRLTSAGFTPAAAARIARDAETLRPIYRLAASDPIPVDLGDDLQLTISSAKGIAA